MPKAIWEGQVIAEASADAVATVEGNIYFPPDAVRQDFLRPSVHHTVCAWKGTASYYDVVIGGKTNQNAAWFYPQPKDAAKQIAGRIAFWHGVQIVD